MNSRLSQRVYSESSLEFWLQRLAGDWETLFSARELEEGRRLYRTGCVRQLELGETDAIVHLRLPGQGEAYVVLDWEQPRLTIRTSTDDPGLRRLLAVAGLYEVEELVGDEASALPPESAGSATASQAGGQNAGPAETLAAAPAVSAAQGGAQRAGETAASFSALSKTGGAANATTGTGATAPTTVAPTAGGPTVTAPAAGGLFVVAKADGSQRQAATAASTAHTTGQPVASPVGASRVKNALPGRTAAGATATLARQHGDAPAQGLANAHGLTQPEQGTPPVGNVPARGALPPVPQPPQGAARELVLHLRVHQGALQLQANWKHDGRRALTPAFGRSAPEAAGMSEAEREALIRLASLARRAGFRYDKTQDCYRMTTALDMEAFVSRELGNWAGIFSVTQEPDVLLLGRGVREVSLQARIDEADDDSLSLHWDAVLADDDGDDDDSDDDDDDDAAAGAARGKRAGAGRFTAAERRRLLHAGAEPLLLPGRGLVRLSEKQARASERLNEAVNLFPGGKAPRYLLFSMDSLADLPIAVAASLQRWRQQVLAAPTAAQKGEGSFPPPAAYSVPTVSSAPAAAVSTTASTPAAAAPAAGASKLAVETPAASSASANPVVAAAGGALASSSSAASGALASVSASAPGFSSACFSSENSLDVSPLPEFLRGYQRLGVEWMRHLFARGCHGLLADEMGLGKTVQVLSLIATSAHTGKPALVVCPASVVPVWQAQARQFFPELTVKVLGAGCTFADAQGAEAPHLWLASYTQLRRHKALLEQAAFSVAVLDEAQFIKNPDAKVTQACLSLRAEHRLALTGTPLENRYLDVWTLFRFLMPGLLGSRRRFEETLAADEERSLERLRTQLAPFILRRTKSEVASELPEKIELDLICPLSDLQRAEYQRLITEGAALYAGAGQTSPAAKGAWRGAGTAAGADSASAASGTASAVPAASAPSAATVQPTLTGVLTLLTRLRQVACDPALLPWMNPDLHHSGKLNLLRDRLGEVFANGKKAVVFSQFVSFLDRAKAAVRADYPQVPVFELTGRTRERQTPVERFQAQEGAGVMLVSLRAGGTGITLHAADYVFLLDPWWNPAVEDQAIDRVHRIGQVNRVFVYRMVTAGTVEARVAALKQTKRERFERIVQGASGGEDFRDAFRSLELLLGLLREEAQSVLPESADAFSAVDV